MLSWYAEICSGRQPTTSSKVLSSISIVIPGTPVIRSMLMSGLCILPCSSWKALRHAALSCLRLIHRRMPSSSDCTPMLMRVTPSSSSPRTYSGPLSTISSGFTSMVNSAYRWIVSFDSGRPGWSGAAVRGSFLSEPVRGGSGANGTPASVDRIRRKTERGSTLGVPPPMYKVSRSRVETISCRRASISSQTPSAQRAKAASSLPLHATSE